MKSLSRAITLVVSVLLILIVPYIPHHHHHGEVCMERVLCAHDLEYNDVHTGHDAEDTHDAGTCVKHVVALQVQKKHGDSVRRRVGASLLHTSDASVGNEKLVLALCGERRLFVDSADRPLMDCIVGHLRLRAPPITL